jgi:hypothetical protein
MLRLLICSVNGWFARTTRGAPTISSDGAFSAAGTSPWATLTQRGPSWKPVCAWSLLFSQSWARGSSGSCGAVEPLALGLALPLAGVQVLFLSVPRRTSATPWSSG